MGVREGMDGYWRQPSSGPDSSTVKMSGPDQPARRKTDPDDRANAEVSRPRRATP